MINGLLTLRGAWDKVREDAVLKFMVVAVTAYGMATFEGPMLSLKNVNAIMHYTDWIVAHVHVGALGWNGFLTFGILYWLVPKMWNTQLYSKKLANVHFWIATLGIVFYAVAMYTSGLTQSLLWKQFTAIGTLQYPNFLETVLRISPLYAVRAVGGTAVSHGFRDHGVQPGQDREAGRLHCGGAGAGPGARARGSAAQGIETPLARKEADPVRRARAGARSHRRIG